MQKELENILEDCKIGYEMYPLYCKIKYNKNINVDY